MNEGLFHCPLHKYLERNLFFQNSVPHGSQPVSLKSFVFTSAEDSPPSCLSIEEPKNLSENVTLGVPAVLRVVKSSESPELFHWEEALIEKNWMSLIQQTLAPLVTQTQTHTWKSSHIPTHCHLTVTSSDHSYAAQEAVNSSVDPPNHHHHHAPPPTSSRCTFPIRKHFEFHLD